MISDLCEQEEHGACFDDEIDGCRCACHPTDCLAGIGRTTTEQPSTGGARQATPLKRADGRGPTHPVRAARDTLAPGSAGRAAPPSPVGGAAHLSSPQPGERQAAGRPGPGAGETDPASGNRMPASPGRGRTPSPAGGALEGARGVPAGTTGRTFTIALPPGMKLLSLNGREHWSERARRTEALKTAAWAVAHQAKVPMLDRVSVVVEYQPPDRRHRDAENTCAASGKACIDGIVAAGVLEDDECPRYVAGIWCTIGELYPKGRLVLHLTEISAATGSDAA